MLPLVPKGNNTFSNIGNLLQVAFVTKVVPHKDLLLCLYTLMVQNVNLYSHKKDPHFNSRDSSNGNILFF